MSSSAAAYGKAIGGRLQLKGVAQLKPKHKKKHKKKRDRDEEDDGDDNEDGSHKELKKRKKSKEENQPAQPEFKIVKSKGTGRILSSGTTIMGQPGTRFLHELAVGDALIIQHPMTMVEETRIVRMVLSDVSCSVSSAFSSDLVSSTPFQYIKAPPPEQEDATDRENAKKQKRSAAETLAFGTYAGGTETGSSFTYRVKKGGAYGGYALVSERADTNRSREDLLDLRAKKKGDRHCM